mmetsp:Transcript_16892/g.30149  ORF Transcript_16892/g.30149 Transcript_16892/m.30149 type:complete len:251 (-) Transcript_16892:528-1280(-)
MPITSGTGTPASRPAPAASFSTVMPTFRYGAAFFTHSLAKTRPKPLPKLVSARLKVIGSTKKMFTSCPIQPPGRRRLFQRLSPVSGGTMHKRPGKSFASSSRWCSMLACALSFCSMESIWAWTPAIPPMTSRRVSRCSCRMADTLVSRRAMSADVVPWKKPCFRTSDMPFGNAAARSPGSPASSFSSRSRSGSRPGASMPASVKQSSRFHWSQLASLSISPSAMLSSWSACHSFFPVAMWNMTTPKLHMS